MKKIIYLAVLGSSTLFLTACTVGLNPNYHPQIVQNHAVTKDSQTITIKVNDSRATDPNLVDRVYTAGYTPSGVRIETYTDYKLKQPVSAFVADSLKAALTQAGYKINDDGQYLLNVQLMKVKVLVQANGVFSNPNIHVKIQANVSVVRSSTSAQVWKTTFNVDGNYHMGWADSRHRMVEQPLDDAMNQLADQIISNAQLNQLLK